MSEQGWAEDISQRIADIIVPMMEVSQAQRIVKRNVLEALLEAEARGMLRAVEIAEEKASIYRKDTNEGMIQRSYALSIAEAIRREVEG